MLFPPCLASWSSQVPPRAGGPLLQDVAGRLKGEITAWPTNPKDKRGKERAAAPLPDPTR